jgi:hypothetical protein
MVGEIIRVLPFCYPTRSLRGPGRAAARISTSAPPDRRAAGFARETAQIGFRAFDRGGRHVFGAYFKSAFVFGHGRFLLSPQAVPGRADFHIFPPLSGHIARPGPAFPELRPFRLSPGSTHRRCASSSGACFRFHLDRHRRRFHDPNAEDRRRRRVAPALDRLALRERLLDERSTSSRPAPVASVDCVQ